MTNFTTKNQASPSYSSFTLFIALCAIAYTINFLANDFIITDEIYFDYFGDQYALEKISEFIDFQKKWQWLTYLLLPIVYFLKILLVSFCLATGLLFYDYKFDWRNIFKWVLCCEFVFIVPALIKVVWFGVIKTDFNLMDVYSFSPLSAMNLMSYSDMEQWLIYPLQTINLFEMCYIFLLSYGLKNFTGDSLSSSMKVTVLFYGTALLLWLAVVSYLNISFS